MRPIAVLAIAALAGSAAGAAVSDRSPSARVIGELNAFDEDPRLGQRAECH
jgi:hypothetical protein